MRADGRMERGREEWMERGWREGRMKGRTDGLKDEWREGRIEKRTHGGKSG